jgi:hypothetical protein
MSDPTPWETLIGTADYVEKLKSAEQQWIMSRMAWLLTSQSFCILAYIQLVRSSVSPPTLLGVVHNLYWLLPALGLIISIITVTSRYAAERVSWVLIDTRAELTGKINEIGGTAIPEIGARRRDPRIRGTLLLGRAVFLIPFVLAAFWAYLLIEGL